MISNRNRLQVAMLVSAVLHAALAWTTLSRRSHGRTEAVTTAVRPASRAEGRAPFRVRLLALDAVASDGERGFRADAPPATSTGARLRGAARTGSRFIRSVEPVQAPVLSQDPEPAGLPRPSQAASDWAGEAGQPSALGSSNASTNATANGSAVGRDDTGWLADLHRRLNAAAQSCYPPSARRLRLQGEVSLFFALNEQGEAKRVQLAHSSGSAILDEAAMDCVLRGALPAPGRAGEYGPVTIKFAEQR